MIPTPRPEYPRPQFRRKDWTNLNGEWSFAFDDPDAGLASSWQNTDVATLRSNDSPFERKITVPYCYQSKLSGIGETAFHDIVWYARSFEYVDPTRPVVSNDGWEHAITDLCTIHDYRDAEALAKSYSTPESSVAAEPANKPVYVPGYAYRGEPILITEFGGIAFAGDERGWGYSTVADTEEFLERYSSLVEALLRSSTVQGFCYTQLTDVEQEINGLLTYDRNPKVDPARVRKINDGR